VSELVSELAAEIYSSNPSYSPEEISNQIVFLIENEILPSVIEKLRLPKPPSPIDLRIERFRKERQHGKKDVDELKKRIGFIQGLERLRSNYYFSDFTYEGLQIVDPGDFSQKPFAYPIEYLKRKKEHALQTDVILPKLEPESFSDVSERKSEKPSEFVSFDLDISKKIYSDPHFEKAIASVESGIRERFKGIPNIAFNFSLRQDIGDHNKKKTIIRVKIPNSNFREKMNYWLRIDLEVRKAIRALDFAEEERKEINRNLVTHIESA
jgi:hypothetical protein